MIPHNAKDPLVVVGGCLRAKVNDNSCGRASIDYSFNLREAKHVLIVCYKLEGSGQL
jgi:hypothetical protein